MGFIYKITNKINGKAYVGETTQPDPEIRWRQHILCAKKTNGCPILSRAFNKHGIDNFKFEVLIICFNEDCLKYETYYIEKYGTLAPNRYNGSKGGKFGGFQGHKHNEETKKLQAKITKELNDRPEIKEIHSLNAKKNNIKMHEGKRKKKENAIQKLVNEGKTIEDATKIINELYILNATKSEITKKKVSESLKKYHRTKDKDAIKKEKEKAKIDGKYKPRKTRILTDETKKKLSEAMKKYHNDKKYTEEDSEKRCTLMAKKFGKPVNQYSIDGTLIATYTSINEASRITGIHKWGIQTAIKSEDKLHKDYKWEFAIK
jgi:group I intron endonuclease